MKKLAFAFLLSTVATGAFAADAVVYEESAPVEVNFFSWTGGYVGLHAGYAWGNENDNQSELFELVEIVDAADQFDVDGFIGGVHAGYNWQTGNFVFGVEGDIDYANIEGGADFDYGIAFGTLSFESDWQGSLRLRAGYAMDTWLLYATGGVAFAHAEMTAVGDGLGGPFSVSDENTHTGWTIGGGVEKAFTPNWIGRLEVRYTDFSNEDYFDGAGGTVEADWDQTAVSVGISYKF